MPTMVEPEGGTREWEAITTTSSVETDRLRVPGGWLYRTLYGENGVSVCFVPWSDERL